MLCYFLHLAICYLKAAQSGIQPEASQSCAARNRAQWQFWTGRGGHQISRWASVSGGSGAAALHRGSEPQASGSLSAWIPERGDGRGETTAGFGDRDGAGRPASEDAHVGAEESAGCFYSRPIYNPDVLRGSVSGEH